MASVFLPFLLFAFRDFLLMVKLKYTHKTVSLGTVLNSLKSGVSLKKFLLQTLFFFSE